MQERGAAIVERVKQALETGRGVYAIVLEKGRLSKEELDELLTPENMLRPRRLPRK